MKAALISCLFVLAPVASFSAELPAAHQADSSLSPAGANAVEIGSAGDADSRYRLRWAVSLDAAGRVVGLEPATQTLVDIVRVPLEGAIRQWRFVPGKVDGRPAPTETVLTLDIALVSAGNDKLNVRIEDARTGGDIAIKGMRKPPHYPPDAVQHRWQGMVVLKVDYDAEGRAVNAIPADNAPAVAMSLVRSAEKAVKEWTFTPEVVGGHALAGSAIVTTCFEIVPHGMRPEMKCGWTPPGARSALHDNEAFAIEPAARLETDVIGHTL
jgi:hypothetical protein